MKKLLLSSITIMTLSLSAQASGWEILPVLNDNHKLNPAVAIIGGSLQGDESGDKSEAFYGLEISMDCPLLKVPTGKIRQQANLTSYDNDGIKMNEFNLNPHYQISLSDSTSFGVGPSFGVAQVELEDEDDTIFTYGVGASVRTNLTNEMFIGAEARYTMTSDAEFFGEKDDFNNYKFFVKLGYQF